MKIYNIALTTALMFFSQNTMASDSQIIEYQFPFKGDVSVRMRLSDVCDEQKIISTIKNRGIPESSPQYKMMIGMLGSQCTISKKNHIIDSIAFDIKGKTRLEVLDKKIIDDVTMFQITIREYESHDYLNKSWVELTKRENLNSLNGNFILTKGAYNTANAFMHKDNVLVQIDMMQSQGKTTDSLSNFANRYSDWLINKK